MECDNFLSLPNSGYIHHVYNHGRGQFGYGLDSMSRIENVWSELKALIKRIYSTIRQSNFLFFIKGIEYRHLIKSMNEVQKLEDFAKIISCVGNDVNQDLLKEGELNLDFDINFDD